jgi:hypothetical protein
MRGEPQPSGTGGRLSSSANVARRGINYWRNRPHPRIIKLIRKSRTGPRANKGMTARVEIAGLCGLSAGLIALAMYFALRRRTSPEKREQKRRLSVNRLGRLGDAMITEASDTAIYYTYSVHGVQYAASQDISALREHLPVEPERLIGGVASLKYAPKNPANSILICEEWSGLRQQSAHIDRVRHQS